MTPQTLYKRPLQSVAATAQSVAKLVKEETKELVQTAESQVKGETKEASAPQEQPPQVVQSIQSQGESFDREAIARQERAMLADLENQLAAIRQRNAQTEIQYQQSQDALMHQGQTNRQESFVPPQGKLRQAVNGLKRALTGKRQETKAGGGK